MSRCSRFSATKNHRLRPCRPMCFTSFKQFFWLAYPKLHTAFSGFPNDRLSSSVAPPRIQRRYRPGLSPGFLFSYGAVTASTGTQTEYSLAYIWYMIQIRLSIEKRRFAPHHLFTANYTLESFAKFSVKLHSCRKKLSHREAICLILVKNQGYKNVRIYHFVFSIVHKYPQQAYC